MAEKNSKDVFKMVDIPACHNDVLTYRKAIANEWGYDDTIVYEDMPRKVFPDTDGGEEVYKITDGKWNRVGFDAIIGLYCDNVLASTSGVKTYGDHTRVGMFYYTLRPYRKVIRSPLWRKDGMIDYVRDRMGMDKLFFTIYPHNNKLKSWCNALLRNQNFGQLCKPVDQHILDFKIHTSMVRFNNVDQLLAYDQDCDLDKLMIDIGAREIKNG